MSVIGGLRFSVHPPRGFGAEDARASLHEACEGCHAELRGGLDIRWPSPAEPAVITVNRLATTDLLTLEGIHERMRTDLAARGVDVMDSGVYHPEPLELHEASTPGVLYDEDQGVVTIEATANVIELTKLGKDRMLIVSEQGDRRIEEYLPHVLDVVDLRHGSFAP